MVKMRNIIKLMRGGVMLKKLTSDIYPLMHPKGAVFVTSVSKEGKHNVMSCAWTTPVSEAPPIVIICIAKEGYTSELIKQTKQFALNIPTKKLLKAIWICGKLSGRKTDKFKKAGLKIKKAKSIKAPLIDGCIGYLECELIRVIEAGECYAFFGRIINAAVDDKYFKDGLWSKVEEIPLHLGGNTMVYAG